MGNHIKIRTGIITINEKGCRVQFEIENTASGKIAADGWFDYIMIDIASGRGTKVTEDMIETYSI
jgi:thioesterase-3